jgi:hypothetical protein
MARMIENHDVSDDFIFDACEYETGKRYDDKASGDKISRLKGLIF